MYALTLEDPRDRHLGRILQLQSVHNGDTPFLITDSGQITFGEAEALSNRLATGLREQGIGAGDRVAMLLGNRPEMVLLCLALNKLGAIWVPICTDYRGEWLLDALSRSRPALLVTDAEYADRIAAITDQLGAIGCIALDDCEDQLPCVSNYQSLTEYPPLQPDYDALSYVDTCAILWTSGTTGRSKGVMQAHNNWVRSTLLGAGLMYNSQAGDIIYCALPLYNSGAWITCIIRALITGIGCAIEKKFSASQFIERIKYFNATQTFAVGAMGLFLMSQPERADDADNPLREAAIVPMPPDLWEVFEKRFGVKLLTSGLGMSECLLVLNQLHTDLKLPVYSMGFAAPDVDVRLFDDDGREVPDGEPGEICVKPLAPHILFNGYFDAPEATAATYRGDWFLTGDMARRDPQTRAFYFVDRKKDAVRFAGRNISTLEVESVVRRHPAVLDVAAFGIPSAALESEDELKLAVVRKAGETVTAEALCDFIATSAPAYFVPRYLDFVDELPYTPTNKVQKFVLRNAGNTESTWDKRAVGYRPPEYTD